MHWIAIRFITNKPDKSIGFILKGVDSEDASSDGDDGGVEIRDDDTSGTLLPSLTQHSTLQDAVTLLETYVTEKLA